MTGAYWGLTAVYILGIGFSQNDVAWFMAASLLGGLLAQWPLGALSDRNRRYAIMLSLALIAIAAAIAITSMAFWDMQKVPFGIVLLLGLGIIFGAGFHPFYSLCMAHTNDFVPAGSYVHASAGLQLTQSIGAAAGPLIAGFPLCMVWATECSMHHIALLSGSFIVYRLLDRSAKKCLTQYLNSHRSKATHTYNMGRLLNSTTGPIVTLLYFNRNY